MIILTKSKSWGKDSSNVTRFEWGAPTLSAILFGYIRKKKKKPLGMAKLYTRSELSADFAR